MFFDLHCLKVKNDFYRGLVVTFMRWTAFSSLSVRQNIERIASVTRAT